MLEAVNVRKSYSTAAAKLDILRGVDLTVKDGESVAILGPSGAGKSTLLHILGGLDDPNDGGRVSLNGQSLYEINEVARAKIRNESIGFVFQFYHLLPEFTALENVLMPLMIRYDKNSVKGLEEKGMEYLKKVGMESRATHRPQQLSGGEQQRLAIARAVINEPKLILCDEPTGNLDSGNSKAVAELLLKLTKENNRMLVIVTHEEDLAQRTDRVLHMRDGRLTS
jgi:lipoprotein-releasing system ATP-binding protein